MKLPDILKDAVESQDWNKICKVYTALTGQPLSPPKPKPVVIDYANLDIPDELLDDESSVDEDNDLEDSQEDEGGQSNLIITDFDIDLGSNQESLKKKVEEPSPEDDTDSGTRNFIASAKTKNLTQQTEDGKTFARREPMTIPRVRKNRFQDDKSIEAKDLKENNPQLQKLYGNHQRVTRSLIEGAEDTSKDVAVQCSLCERPLVVSAALATTYDPNPDNNTFKCNDCSTPSGRRKAQKAKRAARGF